MMNEERVWQQNVSLVDFSLLLSMCRDFSSVSALTVTVKGFCKHAHILTWMQAKSSLAFFSASYALKW